VIKNIVIDSILLVILCILQQYAFSRLVIFGAMPDIVTIFIAFTALRYGQKQGTTFGFAAGIVTGILSGNIGIETLSKTLEGFIAGYFHIPEDSHASSLQKKQMFYKGVFLASLTGRILYTLTLNVLSLPTAWHITYSTGLATLLTMILAVLCYQLFLKKILAKN